ncbi:MAG: DUF3048 domain-containing protein, partial [Caldilineaceae bacterium]|nr:DUF3048 domain-containing protein [Caldilineaceae bacterium]
MMQRTNRPSLSLALLLFAAVLLLAACGSPRPEPTPTPTKTPAAAAQPAAAAPTDTPAPVLELPTATPAPPTPTPQPGNISPFTGLPVADPAVLTRAPIFVCVNNDAAGRAAHYGLSKADLVYEYIVDGFTLT